MNLKNYLDIAPEVKSAVEAGKPVVALESTILSHGMPYPENLTFAAEVERIIRAEGAVPATMAIIDGRMKVGLSAGELELMCKGENVAKVSRRDLPILLATGGTGATTVATGGTLIASFLGVDYIIGAIIMALLNMCIAVFGVEIEGNGSVVDIGPYGRVIYFGLAHRHDMRIYFVSHLLPPKS